MELIALTLSFNGIMLVVAIEFAPTERDFTSVGESFEEYGSTQRVLFANWTGDLL